VAFSAGLSLLLFVGLDLLIGHLDCPRKLRQVEALTAQAVAEQRVPVVVTSVEYDHGLKPNFEGMSVWGPYEYAMRTDSLGLKSREVRDVPLTNTTYRILFLGDSFTEGIGFSPEHTFVGRVEPAWSEPGAETEVLNFGVRSYSPKLHYLKVRHYWENLGFRFQEAWIFIDTSDVHNELEYGGFEPQGFAGELPLRRDVAYRREPNDPGFFERSLVYRTVCRHLLRRDPWHRERWVDQRRGASFNFYGDLDGWIHDDQAYRVWGKTGLALARHYTQELVTFLREHGVWVGLAVYPWPNELERPPPESLNERVWQAFAEEQDLPLFSLYAAFREGDPNQVVRDLFVKGDCHWNEQGHAFVAERWLQYRRSLTDLPALR